MRRQRANPVRPVPDGTPWRDDAVGNAVWEGVPSPGVLRRAGVADGAVDLVARRRRTNRRCGAVCRWPGARSRHVLVLRMNGAPLPAAHGGPVRLLVPGWAGIASTKWLVGIDVLDHAFAGPGTSTTTSSGYAAGTPVRPMAEMPVKSLIAAPRENETLPAGRATIAGYAWSGYGAVARVEVSVDGGTTWNGAACGTGRPPFLGALFELGMGGPAGAASPARPRDRRTGQPAAGLAAWNGKGYGQNSIHAGGGDDRGVNARVRCANDGRCVIVAAPVELAVRAPPIARLAAPAVPSRPIVGHDEASGLGWTGPADGSMRWRSRRHG